MTRIIRNPGDYLADPEVWEPSQPSPTANPVPAPSTNPVIQPSPFEDAIRIAATETPQVTTTLPQTTGLALHLDGDYLAYYASGNDDTVPGQARQNALDLIESFRSRVGAETVIVHNTSDGSTKGERFLIAKVQPYQGHRSSSRKPKNHAYLRDFLLNYTGGAFVSTNWADREADDAIGQGALTAIGGTPGYAAIATKDKDMRMLPGYHINWTSRDLIIVPPGAFEVIGVDNKLYGLKFFWQQMLEGDSADNIPGLEYYKTPKDTLAKIGPKTAENFLAGTTTSDEAAAIVIDLYKNAYQDTWAVRFVEQAALLWMRTSQTGEVDDFATHNGHSRINTAFDSEILDAAADLKDRVTLARQSLNELSN